MSIFFLSFFWANIEFNVWPNLAQEFSRNFFFWSRKVIFWRTRFRKLRLRNVKERVGKGWEWFGEEGLEWAYLQRESWNLNEWNLNKQECMNSCETRIWTDCMNSYKTEIWTECLNSFSATCGLSAPDLDELPSIEKKKRDY